MRFDKFYLANFIQGNHNLTPNKVRLPKINFADKKKPSPHKGEGFSVLCRIKFHRQHNAWP